MQKLSLKQILYKYRYAAIFLLFAVEYISYFLIQRLRTPVYTISAPLDDWIPFCEWFIIPYAVWYLYISLPLIWLFFQSREHFVKTAVFLFSGMFLCSIIFILFPNSIDFRPTAFPRDNILIDFVQLIYANDKPTNVCPSLHCYESIVIHISLIKYSGLKGHTKTKILSFITAVMICLSTMFIKQHSVVDVVCGVALAIILYFVVYYGLYRNKTRKEQLKMQKGANSEMAPKC